MDDTIVFQVLDHLKNSFLAKKHVDEELYKVQKSFEAQNVLLQHLQDDLRQCLAENERLKKEMMDVEQDLSQEVEDLKTRLREEQEMNRTLLKMKQELTTALCKRDAPKGQKFWQLWTG